ncbi:Xaa-Pro aminopeptidase/Xaa-Pro dipeptidase [Hydrogenispora ethanolica]|uniref:Xaa-Pro aminopeptidase/Xaa-Pro dipeptidase n=1 Tax=Hydrogenispora ethanolica TaxID=1082276 RepID=A0A4R1RW35_HYDET|nr:Xaa-Pro peptidase family protein [Hydrogenispora ethanolica]TCL70786.1 Xaa-Pro aminopeptidase/Xaa-Pro dipeptidase [Hydrogenispora ethanolica]
MSRLQKIRQSLAAQPVDGLLVTHPENLRYLSGFSGGEGALLIGADAALLVTDFRYWDQVALEVTEFELWKQGPKLWQSVGEAIQKLGWSRVGFEAGALNYADYASLGTILQGIELIPTTRLIEEIRVVKDEHEIELLAEAERITDHALAATLERIRPGVQEREIALEFDYQLRLNGAEGSSFSTIVVSGWRAALPHGAPSNKEVAVGELLTIDGGALYQGYHADMTRTVAIGKADAKQREIYQIVLEAQNAALDYLKAGLPGRAVDKVARDIIAAHGYAERFGHGLGHCVGLNIHENPRLSPSEPGNIPAGAVVTVEPGIYLPDWGGVRIEDLMVVGEDGIRNLTGSPKQELMEIG